MGRKVLYFKWFIICVIFNLCFIKADVILNIKVDEIETGLCSAESIRKITKQQYYHNFDFIGTCIYSIKVSGSTELPAGSWLIIGLLYNDIRLNANKQVTVEEDGTFKTTLGIKGVFKGERKIFPGEYKLEVWYLPERQDPDIKPKLTKFNTEKKRTVELVIWDDTTNLPLHLEIYRLIKFYSHLIFHLEYLINALNNEFNKYFPADTPDEIKKEYKKAYKLYKENNIGEIDYKKLCFSDLCLVPNVEKQDFAPAKWQEFARRWKKTALFFYNLARSARDNCLINPFPEIASTATLTAEALLSYLSIYEKRLFGSIEQNPDPLNPIPTPKGISITQLYIDFVKGLNILKNKVSLLKDQNKSISLVKLIRKIHENLYTPIVKHINELQKKLKKEKEIKKLIKKDDIFIRTQLKKLKATEKQIEKLSNFAKQRKNTTLIDFSNSLKNLTGHLAIFYARQGVLNYKKFLKPKGIFTENFLENFRIFRNSFLLSLKSLLQQMGNEELYINLGIEEEIKATSIPAQLTTKIEKKLDEIFKVFKTNKADNPAVMSKSYFALKNYGPLVVKYILKKKLLDSKFRFERIYAIHYLKEENALDNPEVEKTVIKHINEWFTNDDYSEEVGFLYEMLSNNAQEKYLDILHKGMTHKDPVVRSGAIVGIVKISSPKSFDLLLNALKDESDFVRGYAKDGLENIVENPIELDVKTIDPKSERGKREIEGLIEILRKDYKSK